MATRRVRGAPGHAHRTAPDLARCVPKQLADAQRYLQALRQGRLPGSLSYGAIIRTEFDTVVIQQDICNGCGYRIPSCPFGVPLLSPTDHKAHKCTLCYDRLVDDMEPACAKACPTDSIQFGTVDELLAKARERTASLKAQGVEGALSMAMKTGGTGGIEGLHAFFALTAPPEVYNLPAQPELPHRNNGRAYLSLLGAALAFGAAAVAVMRGE